MSQKVVHLMQRGYLSAKSKNSRDNSRLIGEKSYCQMWIALPVAGLSDIPTHTYWVKRTMPFQYILEVMSVTVC